MPRTLWCKPAADHQGSSACIVNVLGSTELWHHLIDAHAFDIGGLVPG
jgi:hypothetical protein